MEGVDSRDEVKHNERSDELFLERVTTDVTAHGCEQLA